MKQVDFITIEDEPDQIVSFAIAPMAEDSLTLIRSPQYELLLPEEERGASVSFGLEDEVGLLLAVSWGSETVTVKAQLETFDLDISNVAPEEVSQAKAVVQKMLADGRGDFMDA